MLTVEDFITVGVQEPVGRLIRSINSDSKRLRSCSELSCPVVVRRDWNSYSSFCGSCTKPVMTSQTVFSNIDRGTCLEGHLSPQKWDFAYCKRDTGIPGLGCGWSLLNRPFRRCHN